VPIPERQVLVEVLEGMPDDWTWDFVAPAPSERFTQRELALVEVPTKYNSHGVIDDRTNPFVLWAHANMKLPIGKQRFLVRSRNSARLFVDDKLVVETPFLTNKTDGHNPYKPVRSDVSPNIRPLQPGDHEVVNEIEIEPGKHRLRLEVFVGGKKHRPEVGETSVSIAPAGSDEFWVMGFPETDTDGTKVFPLTDASWISWERDRRAGLIKVNQQRRVAATAEYAKYWQRRHEWARGHAGQAGSLPYGSIDEYINAKLAVENIGPAALCDDSSFVRRIYVTFLASRPRLLRFLHSSMTRGLINAAG
jgi:hypothetical protein